MWLPYLLYLRVSALNALESTPRGTFQFAHIVTGSFKLQRMIGSRFLAECLQVCTEFDSFCQVAQFFENETRCNLGYIVPSFELLSEDYWVKIN